MRHLLIGLLVVGGALGASAEDASRWRVVVSSGESADAAMGVALHDLEEAGTAIGVSLSIVAETDLTAPRILVGSPERNSHVADAVKSGAIALEGIRDAQGFEIRTSADGNTIVVAGGSVLGDVYGVYWLRDRMRVAHAIPRLDVQRTPRLKIRLGSGNSIEDIQNALRQTSTWVWGTDINSLVPWDSEPEGSENATNRGETKKLIDYAHALHLKYIAYCDEISYHPSLHASNNARLSPDDPALWNMLQNKYRLLLNAMPELDGVRIRTGEHTRVSDPYKPYDVMHEPALADWPLEDRYRTFVQKLHEVVVGEFGKIYYHRTWIPDPNEQHSNPDVFKAIFTDAVPTKNLYLSPYLTAADRWFYQPHNPTFNQTPHEMVVLLAAMDYHAHAGVAVAPVYPGQYFHEGMQRIVNVPSSNVVGADIATNVEPAWTTGFVTDYLAFRMAWDPTETPENVARDAAAMIYGPECADAVAKILMLTADAYTEGLYIKPVAEKLKGNTLPQLRLTTFAVRGFPDIDGGKNHVTWAREAIYDPSIGHIDEAIEHLDRGLALAVEMESLGRDASARIEDAAKAKYLHDTLYLTRMLIQTNNHYVKTMYAYFPYLDTPDAETRRALESCVSQLEESVSEFRAAPGFVYKLYGVDQLVRNAKAAIEDVDAAKRRLAEAPEEDAIERLVRAHQTRNDTQLEAYRADAVKALHWQGMIDGKDIVRFRDEQVELEHVMADPPHSIEFDVTTSLPRTPVTALLEILESGEWKPFVLEQPAASNDWTVSIYLFDPGVGYGKREFNLYYVEREPADLGLESLAHE